MNSIKQSLLGGNQDDTSLYSKLYRRPTKPTEQTRIKDNVPLVPYYNYMADILHLPTDKFGYNKLLVVVDIGSDAFDIEKMKGETAKETLSAYNKMLSRGIVKVPFASMLTDGGASFKNEFHKYLYDKGVDHRIALPGRHHQLSSADNLCRQLGDLFNTVMNQQEQATGKPSKAWVSKIDEVRTLLNEYKTNRLKKQFAKKGIRYPVDLTQHTYPAFDDLVPSKTKIKKEGAAALADAVQYTKIKPKYKIGDMVNVLYDEPHKFSRNANGDQTKQNTKAFRMGDMRPTKKKYKIIKVLYYSGNPPFRYLLEDYPKKNAPTSTSFIEQELKQVQ
jgi:hypothetical protein